MAVAPCVEPRVLRALRAGEALTAAAVPTTGRQGVQRVPVGPVPGEEGEAPFLSSAVRTSHSGRWELGGDAVGSGLWVWLRPRRRTYATLVCVSGALGVGGVRPWRQSDVAARAASVSLTRW